MSHRVALTFFGAAVVIAGVACTGILGDFDISTALPETDAGTKGGVDAGSAGNEGGTACVGGGKCTPSNACRTGEVDCSSGTSTCKETGSAANGTSCGSGMVCHDGTCAACAKGTACTPTNSCHAGEIDCSTGVAACNDTGSNVANGASCGTGQVCQAGTCTACKNGASCVPTANPCNVGSLSCADGTPSCRDTGSPATDGTTCGTNMVCSKGTCNACTARASCTPGNACHVGSIDCSTGTGVCTDTNSHVADGASCGTNEVCSSGTCGACTQGASCPPANPCHTGTLSCSTGTPACNDTGSIIANGTSCGTNFVCHDGTCNACTVGAVCTPTNVCDHGAVVCSTGVAACNDTGPSPAANGTTCAAGKVCNNGGCVTPALLAITPPTNDYGNATPPGGNSADQTFTVQNSGQAPSGTISVSMTGANPGAFVVGSDTCSNTTLAGGATCLIKVHFHPGAAGPFSASLTASASPGGSAVSTLSGSAVAVVAGCGEMANDGNTVALWHFDDGTGQTTADSSGNGHTGTLGNSITPNAQTPTWTTGRFGGALSYSSANQQYVQGAGNNTFPTNQGTIEFWEKATPPGGDGVNGYSQPFTAGSINFAVAIANTTMEFGVGSGAAWSWQTANTGVLTNGAWHYVAYVFDGTNQLFYIDGALINTVAANPVTTLAAPSTYQIGGRPSNTFFNGVIDEMRLSKTARSAAAITSYYTTASACP